MVDDEDYEYLMQRKWQVSKKNGERVLYAARANIKGRGRMLMHREIMKIINPKIHCDHIDGDGLNNQKSNLRLVTNSQNQANNITTTGTSIFKGVSFHKKDKKWRAQIQKDGIKYHLGSFNTEVEAAIRYNMAAKEMFGEYARLNIIL